MVKKYYSATFHPKVGRLRFVNVPFARQKATFQSLKTGVILNETAHKSKRMLTPHGLQASKINIRYELIFQIEKNFCPDFLLFITQHKSNKANVHGTDTFSKRCPKGYTSVTVGVPPTDVKKQGKSPEVVILIIKKHSFRIYVLKQHLFGCMLRLVRQPGVASLSFATPGYKSVALRAIANKSAQQSCWYISGGTGLRHTRLQKCSPTGYC